MFALSCYYYSILWVFLCNPQPKYVKQSVMCAAYNLIFPNVFLQCETTVEQHEDEVIEFFAHETENVKDKLCSKRTGVFNTQHAECILKSYTLLHISVMLFPSSDCISINCLLILCALQTSVTTLWKCPTMNFDIISPRLLSLLSRSVLFSVVSLSSGSPWQ